MTKKKVLLTTLVAFLVLLAVVAAGLNVIFTVTTVKVDFVVYSEQGSRESEQLQEKLNRHIGESTTFLSLSDVEADVAEFAGFRVEAIKKCYPSTIELRVAERRETYVFIKESGYAVLDADGVYLYDKAENINRAGGENILIGDGFELSLEQGQVAQGRYFSELLSVFSVFDEVLTDARANVVSVSLVLGGAPSSGIYDLVIQMREGVVIILSDLAVRTGEKAAVAIENYAAMRDDERVRGALTVFVNDEGTIDTDRKLH